MRTSILLLIFFISIQILYAQQKSYQSFKIKYDAPIIDGVFDDDIWNQGAWAGDFLQYAPYNKKAPSEKTEFKILYDDNNIYVAIKLYEEDISKIEKRMSRKDGWEGDMAIIQFDSYYDKMTAFVFAVNASGVKNDGIVTNNDIDNYDKTSNPIWYVKTAFTDYGWNAEMKIPLSQLRFSNKKEQKWGLQVIRYLKRFDEFDLWRHINQEDAGWVSNMGIMTGINNIKPKRQVEIAPYLMGKIKTYEKEEGNPFSDGTDYSLSSGVDGKIGLTNNLTLDFAINPDFGHVEADPSEVNLTAYETFFEEKRDFFVEGNNITDFQLTPGGSPWSRDNLFYSRRIGSMPHADIDLNNDEYAETPNNTTILGALKLTGKTKNGLSIGIMESVTSKEKATIDYNGERRDQVVEPMTNYFVTRLQQDLHDGNTIIGGMITSTNRKITTSELNFLPSSSVTGGVDFMQYFKEKKYFISAKLIGSQINGSKEAITEQQLSSRRYYQRPDASYLTLDTNRTSLAGNGGNISFGKIVNTGLRYVFNFTWRSPGLELNDIGYMRRANTMFQYLWVGYKITKPFSVFNSISINANQWSGWDCGGNRNFVGGNVNINVQFKNLWTLGGNISREGDNYDITALRGGPAFILPGNYNANIHFGTNHTKMISFSINTFMSQQDENSGSNYGLWTAINYHPIDNLKISLMSQYNISKNNFQYIDEVECNNKTKYIFAHIKQQTLSFTTRIDYSITPDFTIQYYASPFVCSGLFTDYKKITNPEATELSQRYYSFPANMISFSNNDNIYRIDETGGDSYSFENPDFNFKQFRSNLVLRYEYKAGSTLYLVWAQGISNSNSDGDMNFVDDIKNLFDYTSDNVFLLKFSYRILM